MEKASTQSHTNEEDQLAEIRLKEKGITPEEWQAIGKRAKELRASAYKGIQVIFPPQSVTGQFVFLAGSIEMDQAERWQDYICEQLMNRKVECKIANPRREDWNPAWQQTITDQNFVDQVTWELNALDRASLIVVYFSPGTVSPISLLELGAYSNRNMVVCCPEGFFRKGNVDLFCRRKGIPMVDTLNALVNYIQEWAEPSDLLTLPTELIKSVGQKINQKETFADLVQDLPSSSRTSSVEGILNEMGKMPSAKISINLSAKQVLEEVKNAATQPKATSSLKAFKIKDTVTGLYSTGGYTPRWTNQGKAWSNIGHVKNSLRQHIDDSSYYRTWVNRIPETWVVVEFGEEGVKEYPARSFYPVDNPYLKDPNLIKL